MLAGVSYALVVTPGQRWSPTTLTQNKTTLRSSQSEQEGSLRTLPVRLLLLGLVLNALLVQRRLPQRGPALTQPEPRALLRLSTAPWVGHAPSANLHPRTCRIRAVPPTLAMWLEELNLKCYLFLINLSLKMDARVRHWKFFKYI